MDMWKYLCPRYDFHTNLFVSNNFLTKRSHIFVEWPLSFATIVDASNVLNLGVPIYLVIYNNLNEHWKIEWYRKKIVKRNMAKE
jgi:hypothetical protein